jgi:signal peptidase II
MSEAVAAKSRLPTIGLATAVGALILDRVTKYVMIEQVMRPPGVTETPFFTDKIIELIPVFNFRMAWNTGISFSLFNSGTALTVNILLAVQVVITLFLAWTIFTAKNGWVQFATGLIVGGAIGNIVDRAMYGAVADFLDFHVGEWHFPTFNVADSCISVGVFLWLLDAIGLTPHHAPTQSAKD